MEKGLFPNSPHKSEIIEIKPLRSLAPLIPKPVQLSSQLGFSPFFPIGETRETQAPPVLNPAPLRSFKSTIVEEEHGAGGGSFRSPFVEEETPRGGASGGDTSSSMEGLDGHCDADDNQKRAAPDSQNRKSSQKKNKKTQDQQQADSRPSVGAGLAPNDEGDRESVNFVLMTFDSLRRRLCQLEDANQLDSTNAIKRADLRASNTLMFKGIRTNPNKRVGVAPGVEIGDIFFFRIELCLVGLHGQVMSGIDYINIKGEDKDEPLALSIVSSGIYDDDAEDNDILIYSGQGEHFNKKDKHLVDQKLQRGNLALDRSSQQHNEVRVIRGLRDVGNKSVKIYVYDGLYKIQYSWIEKVQSGGGVFKYKFVRLPGQPSAFAHWKMVQKWKEGILPRSGLILSDLSAGVESIHVPVVNDVDNEKAPASFTYFRSLRHSKPFGLIRHSNGCNCSKSCVPGDLNCSCIQRNGGDFPYTANGILVSRKQMVYECGPMCQCLPNCKNRVCQAGLKLKMEVFKTKDRGWGLRSLDPIRAGTFICEYAGEILDRANVSQNGKEEHIDEYVFDTSRIFAPFKWNYEPSILEEVSPKDTSEDYAIPSPLIISARNVGNVARFMNHSCSPNVFWQPVLYEENNHSFLHIAFFALRHISPLTELTYDYGIFRSGHTEGSSTPKGRKKCLCGSSKCRGSFY
ncbi:hypothetical protein RIF29_30534 [Crotalaria pallida]|uniref:Histone-lysine N-methyltransferase, H3 lysine-9 specific SUVH1 n=1 Tax=Crotalaria pallida TaxID=3830 RepID=A0AAN9HYA9_CROPI